MTVVAVVAHAGKTLGGGLAELRQVLAQEGCTDPIWHEVKKSRKATKGARRALAGGAELIFVWGGDGTVQRCVDALAGSGAQLAIIPAGTANLLAENLRVPGDLRAAVHVGLYGERRTIDTGSVNGEHFAVMAGAGLDARMIKRANRGLKNRIGRTAYVFAGARSLRGRRPKASIKVDGERVFRGRVSCVLTGNVGKIIGGLEVFPGSRPDDGILELGVVTAKNAAQWASVLGRVALGTAIDSRYVKVVRGRRIRVRFDQPVPYELDGGTRQPAAKLRIRAHPSSVTVCVRREAGSSSSPSEARVLAS